MTYEDISEAGFIDQQVTLANLSETAVVPEVRYRALDADGTEVPGITIATVFGSDRGLLVVPPAGFYDVLTFTGDRVGDVVDADAEVVAVQAISGYLLEEEVDLEPLDGDGQSLVKFDPFAQVAVTNSTGDDISYRVVCLVYDATPEGEAQQAGEISVVVDRLTVPAGGRKTVPVSSEFTARTAALEYGCDSLKAHPTLKA